jgi:Putative metal-binding motif
MKLPTLFFLAGALFALSASGHSHPAPSPAVVAAPPRTCDSVWYRDDDGDGYGEVTASVEACEPPAGFAALPGDCDDADSQVHPGAVERCDARDDDCDGRPDLPVPTWYRDADGDGWGDPANTWDRCDRPQGYSAHGDDCDDTDPRAWPGHGCPLVSAR